VAGCGECGDEPSGSCTTELVISSSFYYALSVMTVVSNDMVIRE
jgi:hypothetical protein